MLKITLGNGKVLDNLEESGNNFVTSEEISEGYFDGELENVKIEREIEYADEDGKKFTETMTEEHAHMKLIYCKKFAGDDRNYILLTDYDASELKDIALDARLSYLEMMSEESEI